MRQVLAPDAGVGAVGGDEQVAGGTGAVVEVRGDAAVGLLLVVREGLAEVDLVLDAGEQHLPERHPAHGLLTVDGVVAVDEAEGEAGFQVLPEEAEVLGARAQVARKVSNSSGGSRYFSARLPSGLMPTR